jgi:ATP-binding cassette subfamily C (CFTR/MRP) protein 10
MHEGNLVRKDNDLKDFQRETRNKMDEVSNASAEIKSLSEVKQVDGGELDDSKLVEEEKREIGSIEPSVLLGYIKKTGIVTFTLIMLFIFLMQASKNINDFWTSHWVNDINANNGNALFDLIILGVISGSNSLFTLIRSFIFAYGGIKAAKLTFNELLDNVLEAPVSFFESNPLGRVLNRFSADTYSIDDQLPFITNIFFAQLFSIIGSLAVILFAQWYLIILLIPLLIFYEKIQEKYRYCSRELKRLDSVTSSPLFSNFAEILDGVCLKILYLY